jgi:hypothetical protein
MKRTATWAAVTIVGGVLVALAPGATAGKPVAPTVPVVQLQSANYSRGEDGGYANITVVRDKNQIDPSSVALNLSPGTALEGTDYVDLAGLGTNTVTIPGGYTSFTFEVAIVDDGIDEPNETVNITLVNVVNNAQLGKRKTAKLTINDNDPSSTMAINSPAAVNEGSPITFTISVSGASAHVMGVTATTSAGSASSPSDYVHKTQNFSWPVGDATTRSFTVTPNGGDGDEPTQTFSVVLSSLSNASGGGTGTGTITDTDPAPTFTVGDVSVAEGNAGTSLMTFTVGASGPMASPSNVGWNTTGGGGTTAYAPGSDEVACGFVDADYESDFGILSFAASLTTPPSQTVDIVVCGDTDAEMNEWMTVFLSTATYGVAGDQGIGTITDDDLATAFVANNAGSVPEGDDITFDIALSGPENAPSSVVATIWSSSGGTWNPATTPQTVNFAAGDVLESVTFDLLQDAVDTDPSRFWMELVSPSGVALATFPGAFPTYENVESLIDAWGYADIVDDDPNFAETESNDTASTANVVPAPAGLLTGSFNNGSDQDWFVLTVPSAGLLTLTGVDVPGGTCSTLNVDPYALLYAADQTTLLAYDDDGGGGFCPYLTYAAPSAGTFYLRVVQAIPFSAPWGIQMSFTP